MKIYPPVFPFKISPHFCNVNGIKAHCGHSQGNDGGWPAPFLPAAPAGRKQNLHKAVNSPE